MSVFRMPMKASFGVPMALVPMGRAGVLARPLVCRTSPKLVAVIRAQDTLRRFRSKRRRPHHRWAKGCGAGNSCTGADLGVCVDCSLGDHRHGVWFGYMLARHLVAGLARLGRSETAKDVEILVLQHQLGVLLRQVGRPRLSWTDQAVIAAAVMRLPPARRLGMTVTPTTILR